MIAKVIAHAATRDEALDRLAGALGETVVAGPKTNVAFLKKLCEADGIPGRARSTPASSTATSSARRRAAAGRRRQRSRPARCTSLERLRGSAPRRGGPRAADGAVPGATATASSSWAARETGLAGRRRRRAGRPLPARLGCEDGPLAGGLRRATADRSRASSIVEAGDGVIVLRAAARPVSRCTIPSRSTSSTSTRAASSRRRCTASWSPSSCKPGDRVEKGQRLAVVEAMKMEHALVAAADGEVAEVAAEPGAQVAEGRAAHRAQDGRMIACGATSRFDAIGRAWLIRSMPLHLIKLCVGCDSIADLEEWIEENRAHHRRLGRAYEQTHTTRMVPKRVRRARRRRLALLGRQGPARLPPGARSRCGRSRTGTGSGAATSCSSRRSIPVEPRPYRPFQGWRYLDAKDAPRDLGAASGDLARMPEAMRRELAELGLL